MGVHAVLDELTGELLVSLGAVDEEELARLEQEVLAAKRLFVAGAGRSGLMVRAVAMRLMHLGLVTYVVGETVTPAAGVGDLLLVASASGATATAEVVVHRARDSGARVALVTAHPESSLGSLADLVIEVPATTPKVAGDGHASAQLGGSTFEQAVLLLGDALATHIARTTGQGNDELMARHANLE